MTVAKNSGPFALSEALRLLRFWRERGMRCRETHLEEEHQDDVGLEEPIQPVPRDALPCWAGNACASAWTLCHEWHTTASDVKLLRSETVGDGRGAGRKHVETSLHRHRSPHTARNWCMSSNLRVMDEDTLPRDACGFPPTWTSAAWDKCRDQDVRAPCRWEASMEVSASSELLRDFRSRL